MLTTARTRDLPPFSQNRFAQILLGLYLAIWLWAAIDPVYRDDWLLENLLVFAFFGIMLATHRRFPFSNLSYLFMFVFLSAHALGAHTTYSEHPIGFWMQDVFGFERNHYDRVVHFSFGLLMTYPLREMLMRRTPLTDPWLGRLSFASIAFLSELYEVIEFIVAQLASPKAAYAYLGTQGDLFDAQKDSGLAMIGALLVVGGIALAKQLKRRKAIGGPDQSP